MLNEPSTMIRHWLPRFLVALFAMLAIAGNATTANAQDKLDRALRNGQHSGKASASSSKPNPATKPRFVGCSPNKAR